MLKDQQECSVWSVVMFLTWTDLLNCLLMFLLKFRLNCIYVLMTVYECLGDCMTDSECLNDCQGPSF